MELLAILIALALFGIWGNGGVIQQDGWFRVLRGWLGGLMSGAALEIAAVLLPTAVVALLCAAFHGVLFGLPSLLLLVAVLLYSFGRDNLGEATSAYLERWSRRDFEAALRVLDTDSVAEAVTAPAELHAHARRRYYQRAFARLFAVLFWFVALGPAGAVAYRLASLGQAQAQEAAPAVPGSFALLHWLDWIPVRLLAISYALVGDFDACLWRWQALLADTHTPTDHALEGCGNAALRIDSQAPASEDLEALVARGATELDSIEILHRRALLVWIVVIALLAMI